jgi:hypothetical protein
MVIYAENYGWSEESRSPAWLVYILELTWEDGSAATIQGRVFEHITNLLGTSGLDLHFCSL